MIGDVKSILGEEKEKDEVSAKPLSLTNVSKKSTARRSESNFKRPEKMHRELYNLIGNVETKVAGAVVPTEIRKGFRQLNAQLGGRLARKYKWVPFINEARNDSLQLYHWQRVDKLDNPEPYPFAKFNKVINIPDFTDEEYEKYFKLDKWTLEETRHLFDVCRRFDIRWPIVHDRYDREKYGFRSMEDLKDRFYSIINELSLLKDPTSEPICFDADHERRRKEQLIKQWNRTKEQLEEEEMLLYELKRIEVRKREREKKAQDLQKLINMAEAPASPSVSGMCMSPALGKKKSVFRQKGSSSMTSTSGNINFNPVDISVSAIRFPEFKSAGAHLRSQEMKLPTNIGQKKLKNIELVLKKCKLELNPMGSEAIVAAYNEFRSQVVLLQELKSTLQTAEFELETLRNRLIEEGKQPFEIEPRMRISTLGEGGLDSEEVTGEEGAPNTIRRITSYIDTSSSANPLLVRKRKLGAGSSSIDSVRTRKN
ncbi:Myb-like DNA-binding domain protein [Dictyocaulus viviparus]|uniref:DNA methyltransferase 1-associated protein 1 n=1 Tax=Dictyocaulus viviparus TaxID=29172 RepID=A0A0D8XS88_DICVI|nr:Myb-like DNA-binding domain protein [Dictyocaulus viviparus]